VTWVDSVQMFTDSGQTILMMVFVVLIKIADTC